MSYASEIKQPDGSYKLGITDINGNFSSAITLQAFNKGQSFSPQPSMNFIFGATPGQNTNLLSLTLFPGPTDSNYTYNLNVTSTIPNITYNNGAGSAISPAYYCVVGSYQGQVNYSVPGSGYPPLPFVAGNKFVAFFNNSFSWLYQSPASFATPSAVSNNGTNIYAVTWPQTAASSGSENFTYGTGYSYGGEGSNYGGTIFPGVIIIQWYWPPPITSEICFPAGTPVKTDQGLFPIEKLKPGINTINRNRIEHITRTITNDNYLVCFEKDSLDINLPIRRTLISKNHKILYKNKLIEAYKFINSQNNDND